MREILSESGTFIAIFMIVLVLCSIGVYWHYAVYADIAPKYAATERQIFKNTPSYLEGKIGDLVRYRAQYKQAKDPETKATMKEIILGTVASMDRKELPADLSAFIDELERGS